MLTVVLSSLSNRDLQQIREVSMVIQMEWLISKRTYTIIYCVIII